MKTLLNPKGTNATNNERPANPFKVYMQWKPTEGHWTTKEAVLDAPRNLVLVDMFFSIKGGEMGRTEIFSYPCYREVAQLVKIWEKDSASGKKALIGEGPVSTVFPKVNKENKARKSLYLWAFDPANGELIAIELTGYSIGVFLDLANDMAENPGFTLQVEGAEVPEEKRFNKKKVSYTPIFTVWPEGSEHSEAAIDAFQVKGAVSYLLYMLGEDWQAYENAIAENDEVNEAPEENEEKPGKKTEDPF